MLLESLSKRIREFRPCGKLDSLKKKNACEYNTSDIKLNSLKEKNASEYNASETKLNSLKQQNANEYNIFYRNVLLRSSRM